MYIIHKLAFFDLEDWLVFLLLQESELENYI